MLRNLELSGSLMSVLGKPSIAFELSEALWFRATVLKVYGLWTPGGSLILLEVFGVKLLFKIILTIILKLFSFFIVLAFSLMVAKTSVS